MTEVAISQIKEQFLERATDLNPGVIPSVILVHTLQVCYIINHILWMSQREIQIMALHQEYSFNGLRKRFKRRIMGRLLSSSYVTDQVLRRHDSQSVIQHHERPEYRLELRTA